MYIFHCFSYAFTSVMPGVSTEDSWTWFDLRVFSAWSLGVSPVILNIMVIGYTPTRYIVITCLLHRKMDISASYINSLFTRGKHLSSKDHEESFGFFHPCLDMRA